MKSISLNSVFSEIIFPATQEPNWKSEVDRWYQLDAPAYALTQFYAENREKLGPPPSFIFLASPTASNETDVAFAKSGEQKWSPGKFVHTLPNVRCSPLCQVMKWTGPMLCIQNGIDTETTALHEAGWMLSEEYPVIWVLSVLTDSLSVRAHVLKLYSEKNLERISS